MRSEAEHPLVKAALDHGDKPAIRDDHSTITYTTLLKQSQDLSHAMLGQGLTPGSIIALDNLDPFEMIISFWACTLSGLVAFPLNTRYPVDSLVNILESMDIGLVLSRRDLLKGKTLDIVRLLAESPLKAPSERPAFHPEALASIMMTSGSSGSSKFVVHQFKNHLSSAKASSHNIPIESDDSWLLSLPLYHVGGLSILFRTAHSGAAVILPSSEESLLSSLERHQPTHLSLVATQLKRLVDEIDERPHHFDLKVILLGGSAISPTLVQHGLDLGLPIRTSYGSTEMGSQIATTPPLEGQDVLALGSGKPLPGVDLIIDHTGEILVSGDMLASGYLESGGIKELRDKSGWFHTGDVGYLDVQGYLTVSGRMDNQFISGGENIQPEHIEAVLLTHPLIKAAVIAPEADEDFGLRPVALIRFHQPGVSTQELLTYLRKTLPGYMIPKRFLRLPEKYLNDRLKIPRREIEELIHSPNKQLHSLP